MTTSELLASVIAQFPVKPPSPAAVAALYERISTGYVVDPVDDRALDRVADALAQRGGNVDEATWFLAERDRGTQRAGGIRNYATSMPEGIPRADRPAQVQSWDVKVGAPILLEHNWSRRVGRVVEVSGSTVYLQLDESAPRSVAARCWRGQLQVSPGYSAEDGVTRVGGLVDYQRGRVRELSLVPAGSGAFETMSLRSAQGPFMAGAPGRSRMIAMAERAERELVQTRGRTDAPIWDQPGVLGHLPTGERVYPMVADTAAV